MTHKVKPIQLKKKRARDIKPGEIFTINGDNFVMIEPVCKDDESQASILLVTSNHIPGLENIKCTINNGEFVHVRVSENDDNKNREESENGTEG
jgi:hypothetical protein